MNRSLTFHTILRAKRLVYHEQPLTRGARCISGGYSHDATVEGSVVSGTNPQRKPVRSYQKTLEDTWVEPTRDEFSSKYCLVFSYFALPHHSLPLSLSVN